MDRGKRAWCGTRGGWFERKRIVDRVYIPSRVFVCWIFDGYLDGGQFRKKADICLFLGEVDILPHKIRSDDSVASMG